MSQQDSHSPLVSIYMPTKNRLELLKRAVLSVEKQTYPNLELVVCDDGSTDGTKEYLAALKSSKTLKVKVISNNTSNGACYARNQAINVAEGMFITGLDDDDYMLPNRISLLLAAYKPEYSFISSAMIWDYGHKTRVIDKKPGPITLEAQLSYNEATTQILVEKSRVIEVGGFDETFVACQDYDLWTRLIIAYGEAFRIAEPTYIINDTNPAQRMTGNPKSVRGYEQFASKHGHLMNDKNIQNQEFMKIRRLKQRYSLALLMKHRKSGHFTDKLRYWAGQYLKR